MNSDLGIHNIRTLNTIIVKYKTDYHKTQLDTQIVRIKSLKTIIEKYKQYKNN